LEWGQLTSIKTDIRGLVEILCYSCGRIIRGETEACTRCTLRGGVAVSGGGNDVIAPSIVWGVSIAATIVIGLMLIMM